MSEGDPDAPRRALLRPRITADLVGPLLTYTDPDGRLVCLRLTAVDLAHLQLTAAVTQAEQASRDFNDAVQSLRL